MTKLATILATLALTLAALTMSPAHAKPLGHKFHSNAGSCAKVIIGALGACDFPPRAHASRMSRCYHPKFRERHPVRCERWLKRHGEVR